MPGHDHVDPRAREIDVEARGAVLQRDLHGLVVAIGPRSSSSPVRHEQADRAVALVQDKDLTVGPFRSADRRGWPAACLA